MNKLAITALLGAGVLLLAPSAGHAMVNAQPAYGKAMSGDVGSKPQPAQGSYAAPSDQKPPPKKAAPPAPGKPNYAAPPPGKPNYAAPGPGRPDYRRGPPPGPGYRYGGPPPPRAYYRPWGHRPYYGRIIAGVALGTIIGVTAYGLIPPRPAPDLCWYWADPYRSRGYWDYCD
jgi:hypothetical protein